MPKYPLLAHFVTVSIIVIFLCEMKSDQKISRPHLQIHQKKFLFSWDSKALYASTVEIKKFVHIVAFCLERTHSRRSSNQQYIAINLSTLLYFRFFHIAPFVDSSLTNKPNENDENKRMRTKLKRSRMAQKITHAAASISTLLHSEESERQKNGKQLI